MDTQALVIELNSHLASVLVDRTQNLMGIKHGWINTLGHLLFIKLGRGLGRGFEMRRGWASWGRGLSNVCFQYVANHGLSFFCLV